jgi:hypothetical protein
VPLILAFVEEWPAHLLLALLDLLQETELTHLLDQVLVLLLLLGYLLLFQLLLSLLLLEVLLGFLVLFDLLDKEAATDAARSTIFPRPVLNEESSEGVILTLRGLGAESGYGLRLTTWKAVCPWKLSASISALYSRSILAQSMEPTSAALSKRGKKAQSSYL